MAGSPLDQPAPNPQTIVLNVLSPSTDEVPNKLTFTGIPITTTTRALKARIRNAVPAQPSLSRQRLIYQGKVLASEETNLKDIFGEDAIHKAEPLSLHLVLSPLPNAHLRSSSVPPTVNLAPQANVRQQWNSHLVPPAINVANATTPLQPMQQGDMPNAQQGLGQLPPGFNPQNPPFTGLPINPHHRPAPIPPQVQSAINSQLAAMSQHVAAQFATQGQQHLQGQPHSYIHNQHWQQPAFPQPSFQQIIAQQQQARAAAGQHGVAQGLPSDTASGDSNSSQRLDPSNPGNVNTVVRENQGPNGEGFRMVIQSASISRPHSRVNQRPHSQSHTPQRSPTPANATHNASSNIDISTSLPPQAANSLAMFQHRLSAIETSLAGGSAPPEGVFDHARTYLENMANRPNALPAGLEVPLRTRLNNLSLQAQRLRANFDNFHLHALANQQGMAGPTRSSPLQATPPVPIAGSQPGQQSVPGATAFNPTSGGAPALGTSTLTGQSARASSASEIYLLSSPTGPHSLLIPPSGWYTTTLPPMMPPIPPFQSSSFSQFVLPQSSSPHASPNNPPLNLQGPHANPPNQPAAPPAPMHIAQAQQPQVQQQPGQNNQARDLARILIPLGGHLWLLIRLFGFVYFFTAGGGHRRAILLGICAFIVFVANTGALRPLFHTLWEPVRRHVEGLIPLAAAGGRDEGQQRPRRPQPAQQQQQGRIDNAAAADSNGENNNRATQTSQRPNEPSPSDLADRLLRDRDEQSLFRRAERAVALFVASLIPGVGERHIAARDAAEARRLAVEQEREVQAQREPEGQEEREMEVQDTERVRRESVAPPHSPALAETSGTEVPGVSEEGIRERGEHQGEQRPLVEI
ncbi:MAG: hypothetical protein LQ346_001340 [Caloplaca aetnensis]|nr:MAG: hypothetical protein LQ346_001340 [Caloplaca aetnensis]